MLSVFRPLALLALVLTASAATAAPLKIMAFGDSLTAGYGIAPEEAFPSVLAQRLQADGYEVAIANGGVSGNTTEMGLERLSPALETQPDLVILELGGNDMLNGVSPKVTKANLDTMLRQIKASGARVVFAGMKAITDKLSEPDKKRFEAIYPALAKKHKVPLYPFFLEGVAGNPDLVLWGGLHPKPEGVRIIVDGIAPMVEKALDEVRAKRK